MTNVAPIDPAFELMYVSETDRETDEEMIEELYYSEIQRHPLHILDQTQPKNIYGEPEGEPVYTTVDPPIPIHIKLDPEEEILEKYGYDRKREAMIWFCAKILRDRDIHPKDGDRVDFIFTNDAGQTVLEHLIINEISPVDFSRQSQNSYQVTAAANRTHKAKKP